MSLSDSEAKVLAMVIIGLSSFFIGIFPACFTNRSGDRKLVLSSLLCFGAGVLLATSLVHMLPETRESLSLYAEVVFCGGFLFLYMVDEIVHFFWGKVIDPPPELHFHQLDMSQRHEITNNLRYSRASVTHGYGHSHTGVENSSERNRCHKDIEADSQLPPPCTAGASPNDIFDQNCYEPNLKSTIARVQNRTRSYYGSISQTQHPVSSIPASCCDEERTLLCHGAHTEPCANTNAGIAGLLIALTLHAILEGLAIGVQTETSKVLLLVAAVASHKLVVGFCLGIELAATAGSFVRHAIAIGVFASSSSAGIGIGMVVTRIENNQVTNILLPVLQGVAGGSLLYVTVSEILPRERARWHRTTRRVAGVTQFLSVTCGFFLMFILRKCTEAAQQENNAGRI